jgi:hypothetical protein
MAQEERLITIENTSDEDVVGTWDNAEYVIPAGEQATYRYGVGLHFVEHNPELKLVSESRGFANDNLVNVVKVLNAGSEVLELMWDGHPYHFEMGAHAHLEASLADALILQARSKGGKLVIEGTSEPEGSLKDGQTTVSALAKELDLKVKDLLAILASLEIEAKGGKTPLDESAIARVKEEVAKQPA